MRRKQARSAELTSNAIELFVERGHAACCLEDVARRAGVGKLMLTECRNLPALEPFYPDEALRRTRSARWKDGSRGKAHARVRTASDTVHCHEP